MNVYWFYSNKTYNKEGKLAVYLLTNSGLLIQWWKKQENKKQKKKSMKCKWLVVSGWPSAKKRLPRPQCPAPEPLTCPPRWGDSAPSLRMRYSLKSSTVMALASWSYRGIWGRECSVAGSRWPFRQVRGVSSAAAAERTSLLRTWPTSGPGVSGLVPSARPVKCLDSIAATSSAAPRHKVSAGRTRRTDQDQDQNQDLDQDQRRASSASQFSPCWAPGVF